MDIDIGPILGQLDNILELSPRKKFDVKSYKIFQTRPWFLLYEIEKSSITALYIRILKAMYAKSFICKFLQMSVKKSSKPTSFLMGQIMQKCVHAGIAQMWFKVGRPRIAL